MPNSPVISVVIPLFNKEKHVARALNSVISQSFDDFEVIVVDDGSTDRSVSVVRRFADPRINIIQQPNSGVSAARNRGVMAAKADLIAFLDSDDEWLPDHLETLLKLHQKYPEAGAYTTAYRISNSDLGIIKDCDYYAIPEKPWEGILPSYFKSAAFGFPPVCSSVVCIPKHVLMDLGGFKDGVWWGEDTDLWGRIALRYPIAFSWNGMGIYHTDASNRACNRAEPIQENIFICTAQDAIESGKVSPSTRFDLLEYISSKQIETAFHNISIGERKLARENLKGCVSKKLLKQKYLAFFLTYMPQNAYVLIKRLNMWWRDLKYESESWCEAIVFIINIY